MAQHPPSRQGSELPFAPHLGTSESLRLIQRARAGRQGKAGAPTFSVQSATEKRLSGLSLWLIKGQHGPGCEHMYLPRSPARQRRVSLPEELVSTPMQPSASHIHPQCYAAAHCQLRQSCDFTLSERPAQPSAGWEELSTG